MKRFAQILLPLVLVAPLTMVTGCTGAKAVNVDEPDGYDRSVMEKERGSRGGGEMGDRLNKQKKDDK